MLAALSATARLLYHISYPFVNAFVTKKCIAKQSTNAIMASNLVHMLVDVAALAAVFLVRNLSWLNFAVAIVATAAALSITTIVFTFKLAAKKED